MLGHFKFTFRFPPLYGCLAWAMLTQMLRPFRAVGGGESSAHCLGGGLGDGQPQAEVTSRSLVAPLEQVRQVALSDSRPVAQNGDLNMPILLCHNYCDRGFA